MLLNQYTEPKPHENWTHADGRVYMEHKLIDLPMNSINNFTPIYIYLSMHMV